MGPEMVTPNLRSFFLEGDMISKQFKDAVKLDPRPQYKLAWQAGLNPTTLSQIVTGYIRPKTGDKRVIRVGRLVGLSPDECFTTEGKDADLVKQ
jgi:hypothetical protein